MAPLRNSRGSAALSVPDTGNGARPGKNPTIRLRIEASRKALAPFREFCTRVLCQAGFGEDDCYWVVTAVLEAVTNAVLHGNGERRGTHVDVEFQLLTDGLRITVVDEGDGFDPGCLPDPLSKKHLLAASGRGVFLMRRLMDEVRFSFPKGGGTAVTMVRSIRSAEEKRAKRSLASK